MSANTIKFKVGDRVRVLGAAAQQMYDMFAVTKETVYTIFCADKARNCYFLKGAIPCFEDEDLVLVEEGAKAEAETK